MQCVTPHCEGILTPRCLGLAILPTRKLVCNRLLALSTSPDPPCKEGIMAPLLGSESRKIHPKLRMIANGSTEVNIVRAEQCAPLALERAALAAELPILRGAEPVALSGCAKITSAFW